MTQIQKKTYDVIVIGAGISGLVCGCYLAKAGMKVLIVEQHDKPGGYCSSFKRQGFTFDAAAHTLGGYREGGIFKKRIIELGIDSLIKFTRIDPSDVIVTPNFNINLWNNTQETINNLADIFPDEKNNIKNYYQYYNNQASENQFENVKLMGKTFASFLKSYFTNDALINAISGPVFGYGGIPPSLMQAFTGVKIFNEYLIDGGYYPEGGMQSIPNALDQIIREHSGTILYKRRVEKILCKNNIASGVQTDDNESYISKYVVSAGDITHTFKTLSEEGSVNKQLVNKLHTMIPSISTFILYMGIDRHFNELPQPGTNIWYLPDYDLDASFNRIMRGDFGSGGYMVRVSPDNKTILAFCITPFKTSLFWKKNKKKTAATFLNHIEKFIPNLKKHIVYFDAATPATLCRYTLNFKGANYGWAPLQSQLFDPDLRQKTRVKGLYLTGHWTTRAHGIPGVTNLGYSTAKLILKREEIHQNSD